MGLFFHEKNLILYSQIYLLKYFFNWILSLRNFSYTHVIDKFNVFIWYLYSFIFYLYISISKFNILYPWIYLEFIFTHDVRNTFNCICFQKTIQLSQYHFQKVHLYPRGWRATFIICKISLSARALVQAFCSIALACVLVCVPEPLHCFNHRTFIDCCLIF